MKSLYIKPIFEFEEIDPLCNGPEAGIIEGSKGGSMEDSAAKKGSSNFNDDESLFESSSKSDSNQGLFIWNDEF